MKIQRLVLKNFRSHQETVLELDRFNFIRGPNGCGKSSIQMALEYLFTGRCELTDGAGRGAEALIRLGEKELEVSAVLDSGETICRKRTPRSQVVEINGKRVPVDAAETFLTEQFGSDDVLSAVLNADRFVKMPEAEQQRFLAQLVEAGKIEIPKEIADGLLAISEEPPSLARVADVEAAHKRFYDLRTETNRDLKALGHVEKLDVPSGVPTVQEVRTKLEDLRQQKERLIAQKAETDAGWQNAQARLKQVQTEIEEVLTTVLSPREEQEFVQCESQRARAERLRHKLTELTADQQIVEKTLATIQGLNDKCPTCGQAISAAAKAKESETLRGRLADLEGLIQGAHEELNDCGDSETARSRLEAHRKALARRTKLLEDLSKLQAAQKPHSADIESRMTILAERINKGERVLEKAQQYQSARENWEAHVKEKSGLETRVGVLDRVVEFFGPRGAMMAQGCGRIGSFAESLNTHLAAFGYACHFTLDPFEIRVISSPGADPGLCLRQLSESERFRFSIAIQLAVASATAIQFVVIDRADVLDKEKRKLLTGLLVNSSIEQAIVLATSEEGTLSQVPEGVKFLNLTEQKPSKRVLASAVA